jgi:hypothetical protein
MRFDVIITYIDDTEKRVHSDFPHLKDSKRMMEVFMANALIDDEEDDLLHNAVSVIIDRISMEDEE